MESIVSIIIGIVCILIGVSNRKGNISMLHSYHTKRVSEQDRLPFGKMVGLGMIIVGLAIILMGVFSFIATALQQNAFFVVGNVVLAAGLVSGIGICFYAMIKYNKGIF